MHRNIIGGSLSLGTSRSISNTIQPTETASIAYDGTLLPAGTASYGSELVVNGGFNTDISWTKGTGWTISGGVATFAAGTVSSLISTQTVQVGKTYYVTYEVKSHTGNMRLFVGDGWFYLPTTAGVYTAFLSSGVSSQIYFRALNTTDSCVVDNVSVKEVFINPNNRYLKNLGKDKTPALVESGQGKFFNGTNQYINTGIIPNQAQGTLVTRFTYVSGMANRNIMGMVNANATSRCAITINANGYIGVGFADVSSTISFWNVALVNGKSYHIALRWSGLAFNIVVNNIVVYSGVATQVFAPDIPMYVGALNFGVATNYFNNVIDETYYYDVALSDAQIQSLYLYPEKVKAYNGAIVPDIGSEANCKLFLPLCENSGSNVVNVAVARSASIGISSETPTSATYVSGVLTPTASTSGRLDIRPVITNIAIGDFVEFSVNMIAVNANTRITLATNAGGWAIVTSIPAVAGVNTIFGQIPTGSTVVYCLVYPDTINGTAPCTVGTYTVKEITAYPLTNYTTAMHTSAAKLSYGAQCTAWKRDSLGVLLGMSNGLSFDGGISVKYPVAAIANAIPDITPIVMEAIVYCEATGDFKFVIGSNLLRLGIDLAGDPWCRVGSFQTTITASINTPKNLYHHIAVQANGAVFNAWIDGVQYRTNVAFTTGGVDGAAFILGSSGWDKPYKRIAGTPKIHKGTQYAKFDIVKSWAKAQKTIAKLGA